MRPKIPETDLLADIHRVAETLDKTPTLREYREHGNHDPSTVKDRFGSWNRGIRKAGLKPNRFVNEEEYIKAIQDVASDLGRAPSLGEFNELGEYSEGPADRIFGSWKEAVRAAGLEPVETHTVGEDEEMLLDLAEVASELGEPPGRTQYKVRGEFDPRTLETRFSEDFKTLANEASLMAQELTAQ